jgi:hypothetical protein
MTAHWILLWSYLLPKEEREHMVIDCNRILTVVQDFYFQGGGILVESKIDSILLLFILKCLIHVANLAEA